MRPCQQIRCALRGTPLCPICSECKADPNVIDENCVRCHNCERDEGILRGHIGSGLSIEIKIIQKNEDEKKEEIIVETGGKNNADSNTTR